MMCKLKKKEIYKEIKNSIYDVYKNNLEHSYNKYVVDVIDIASERGQVICHMGDNMFRQIGKSTLISDIHKKINGSIIVVSNSINMTSLIDKCEGENYNIILCSPSKPYNFDAFRGRELNVVLFDDSVTIDFVSEFKKRFPDSYTFGFAKLNNFVLV